VKSLVTSFDEFVRDADWLGIEDQPAITSIYIMAEQIDQDPVGNGKLFGPFGIAYRALLKRNPTGVVPSDPLEEFMNGSE
jgi:hypothetical protein